jgi:hypothetical protein
LPGGYRAASQQKSDWRGTAKAIVNFVASQPNQSFIVYETGFRPYPLFDYYLSRFSPTLRVQGVIPKALERSRKPLDIEPHIAKIDQYDNLVLVFPHLPTKRFPELLAALAQHYEVRFSMLNDQRGFIVYRVRQ